MDRISQAALVAIAIVSLGCGGRASAQCGVASLVNVLDRTGHAVVYGDLLRGTRVKQGHTTFVDLARAAHEFGVDMKGYRLTSAAALKPHDLGVIELTADHFVALVGCQDDTYWIVDSLDGEFRHPYAWSAARLEAEWTGNVLLVERGPQAVMSRRATSLNVGARERRTVDESTFLKSKG